MGRDKEEIKARMEQNNSKLETIPQSHKSRTIRKNQNQTHNQKTKRKKRGKKVNFLVYLVVTGRGCGLTGSSSVLINSRKLSVALHRVVDNPSELAPLALLKFRLVFGHEAGQRPAQPVAVPVLLLGLKTARSHQVEPVVAESGAQFAPVQDGSGPIAHSLWMVKAEEFTRQCSP